jgi:hypothetical protein
MSRRLIHRFSDKTTNHERRLLFEILRNHGWMINHAFFSEGHNEFAQVMSTAYGDAWKMCKKLINNCLENGSPVYI